MNRFEKIEDQIDAVLRDKELPKQLKMVSENIEFDKTVEENPIPRGVGPVNVFGTSWDINAILKGNYWNKTIYSTDKICRLFLKADLNQKKKYLRKKNPQSFNMMFLLLLMIGGIAALLVIVFLLPKLGV